MHTRQSNNFKTYNISCLGYVLYSDFQRTQERIIKLQNLLSTVVAAENAVQHL